MKLFTSMATKNNCYKTGTPMTPKGIMVHSTGCNNPNLRRWVVVPNEPVNSNNWNQPTPDKSNKCVHAFIGKLKDGSIATAQILPWDIVGWHSGNGKTGNANKMGYIGFEIAEDDTNNRDYFNKVYKEATELCAYLCTKYNLDPMGDGVIIGHYEGHKRGIASNHADPQHWFKKHNKTMDDFRRDVNNIVYTKSLNQYEQWCVDNKLFVGDGNGNYNFDQPITRSQVATVLKRLYDLITW